ncbi:MAG: hypothetical protein JWM80_121 [Cyanobacteria bacterium RYN_339]|nr:hypothetical protein [Cyanobacteria bacterium RYN_339]
MMGWRSLVLVGLLVAGCDHGQERQAERASAAPVVSAVQNKDAHPVIAPLGAPKAQLAQLANTFGVVVSSYRTDDQGKLTYEAFEAPPAHWSMAKADELRAVLVGGDRTIEPVMDEADLVYTYPGDVTVTYRTFKGQVVNVRAWVGKEP